MARGAKVGAVCGAFMQEIRFMIVHNNVTIRIQQSNNFAVGKHIARFASKASIRVNVDKPAPRLTIGTA